MDDALLETKPDSPEPCPDNKEVIPCPNPAMHSEYDGYRGYAIDNGIGALIVWFFIIFVVTVLLIYAITPTFTMKYNSDEIDNGKAMLTAFVFSLFIVLLIFAVRWAAGRK